MRKAQQTMALLSLGAALGGCSQQTINSAQHDAQRDVAVVNAQADKAVQEAKPQVKKATLGARVTAALDAANIHGVRVDADTNGVTLHGTVDRPSDKERAGRIARDTLDPGQHVQNDLQVTSR